MCGRSCLTLDPDQIRCACKYKIKKQQKSAKTEEGVKKEIKPSTSVESNVKTLDSEFIIPEWREELNLGRKYIPSYNIAPTDITPVLVSTDYFAKNNKIKNEDGDIMEKRVVVPMMWGMIPFWHKGDYRKHGLTTNNCRLEHMLESKLYRGPFKRGQRCVVLCEGFYEWQTTKSAKPSERAAYMIYMPHGDEVKIYDKSTWQPDNVNLLKMAGIFDVWEDESGEKIYSYSIITFESSKIMSWLHHRMPAILETEEQVNDWLDYKRVTDEQALAQLRPATELKWHQVANIVNNSRNKSEECNKPIKKSKPENQMNKTMRAWLNIRKRREAEVDETLSDESNDSAPDGAKKNQNENAAKRQRYADFKKAKSSSDSASEKQS